MLFHSRMNVRKSLTFVYCVKLCKKFSEPMLHKHTETHRNIKLYVTIFPGSTYVIYSKISLLFIVHFLTSLFHYSVFIFASTSFL